MADKYWVGGTGTWDATSTTHWSDTSGGASGAVAPTSADDVFFNSASNATAYSVTTGTGAVCKSIRVEGPATGAVTFANSAVSLQIYGSFYTALSGVTWSLNSGAFQFKSTSAGNTITTNGNTFLNSVTLDGVGGSWILQDNYTITNTARNVTLTNGTLDLNNNTLSCGFVNSNNSNTRSIAFGTGNITLTGSGTTIWNIGSATGWTITGTPVVNCTYAGSTGTRTIANTVSITEPYQISFNISAGSDIVAATSGFKSLNFTGFTGTLNAGGRTIYGDLTFSAGMTITGGTNVQTFAATSGTKTITTNGQTIDLPLTFNGVGGTWEFADALTQGSTRAFTIANGTVKLKAGATSTIGSFVTSGTNQKYLQSTTAGSQAALSQASGTVTVSYLTIKDIAATGGATWNAFLTSNNVNSGNNTGWDWYYEPGEYMYTRRKTKRLLIQ